MYCTVMCCMGDTLSHGEVAHDCSQEKLIRIILLAKGFEGREMT